MSLFNIQNSSFRRISVGLLAITLLLHLPAESSAANTVPFTSIERAWKKTPLKYFFQKANIYPETFVTEYLGAPTLSIAETDNQIHALPFPIVPFNPMGIDMNFDIVLGISDGSYSMVELIRADLDNQKSIWFVLDSKFNGQQFIGLPENLEKKEIVTKIASQMGLQTYDAYLKEPKVNEGEELTVYSFSYTRKDPEGKNEPKKMNLEVFISHEINVDLEKRAPEIRSTLRARNSSAMNHSESSLLTVIDIYKATPFSKMSKITVKDLNSPDGTPPLQAIIDVEVKSLISQTVLGLGAGQKLLSEENKNIQWSREDDEQVVYSEYKNIGATALQYIDYTFAKLNGKLQLRSIDIKQSPASEIIGSIHFNPALPDFRYEMKPGAHKSKVVFTIRDIETRTDHGFFLGEAHIYNDSTAGGHVIEILPGNATLGHRKIFKTTPEWFYKRALMTSLGKRPDGSIQIDNHILSPQPSNLTEGSYTAKKTETAKLIQAFDIKWDVRAHRLSKLVVKSDLTAEAELRQYKPKNQNLGYGLAYMEAGSWGNGEKAKDLAMGSVCQKELSGAHFYTLSSQSFPMRLSNLEFPYNKRFYNAQEAQVIGIHKLNIMLEETEEKQELNLNNIAIALNGFKLTAGPNHKEIGITQSGLSFALVMKDEILGDGTKLYAPRISETASNILEVYVKAVQNFGPELSRPTSGPWRQNLSSYSAIANIDLLIIQAPEKLRQEHSLKKLSNLTEFHIGKPDALTSTASDRTICLNTEGKADLTKEPITLLTKLEYMSAKSRDSAINDSEALEKYRDTRYIRSISMKIGDTTQPNPFDMKLSNTGELSWATRFVYELGFSTLQPISTPEE